MNSDWPADPRLDEGLRRMVEAEVKEARTAGDRRVFGSRSAGAQVRTGSRFGFAGLLAVGLVLIVAAVALRGTINSRNSGGAEPVRSSATDGDFRLDLEVDKGDWIATESITGTATLSYGGEGSVQLGASGQGPINFQYAEQGGTRNMGPAWPLSCSEYGLSGTSPIVTPLFKTGGWSPDEADASFYAAFFEDKEIHLPPGDWTITAVALFTVSSPTDASASADPSNASGALPDASAASGASADASAGQAGPSCDGDSKNIQVSVEIHVTAGDASPSADISPTASGGPTESTEASPSESGRPGESPSESSLSASPSEIASETAGVWASPSAGASRASGGGRWVAAGSAPARQYSISVRLADDRILIVEQSGAQIYDPATGKFTDAGSPTAEHPDGSATLLADGRVLLAGGIDTSSDSGARGKNTAEIYDPATVKFTPTGKLNEGRWGHTATLLADGKVLLAGGGIEHVGGLGKWRAPIAGPRLATRNATMEMVASAELYDPATGTFTKTGSMSAGRDDASAVRLQDGRVLIMGGGDEGNEALGSAELYDPNTGQFTAAGDMQAPRYYFKSFLLSDGRVLVATGNNGHNDERTIEIYNPSTGKFEDGGSSGSRGFYLVAPTSGGRFLFISGWDSSLLATKDAGALETCDLYDPSTRRLAPAPAIGVAPTDLADAIPLTDGRVVVLTQKGTLIYQP